MGANWNHLPSSYPEYSALQAQLALLRFELLAKQLRVLAQKVLGLILADNQPEAFLSNTTYPSPLRVRKYRIICLPQLAKKPRVLILAG